VPEPPDTAPSLDRQRLERILAPWAATQRGSALVIEDPTGATIAGTTRAAGTDDTGAPVKLDVVVAGTIVARVVATSRADAGAGLAAAVEALAIAIGELEEETLARRSAQRALLDHRSATAAAALGADAVELAKGRRQQRSLLSLSPPDVPGYDLASHYAAAREIGGDFFEFFRLHRRGHPLGIVIADVTGKGLDAALLMAFSRPVMHTALDAARGPAEALERTNSVLVGERRGTLFITALCAVLEPRSGRIRVANAGHEPPLLVPGDGGPVGPVGESGVLIGAFGSLNVPETQATLAPGDTLVFYTDGATDAVGPTGERFGDARFLAAIDAARGGSAHDLVAAVRDAVEAFQGNGDPADDLTIVAVGRRRPARARRTRAS
jgi:serine phosphatase RsbU (regulator of sigma subunit)